MNRVMQRIVDFASSLGLYVDPKKADQNSDDSINIRWLIRRDMPSVMEIEASSFEFPWCEDSFICCLRHRNCIGMVAEIHDQPVGYMVYELYRDRLRLVNFAVHPELRRIGIGQALIATLIGKLSSDRRNRITIEVRETNIDAQLFFRRFGFRAISVLRDHYHETHEDAYLMQYRFDESKSSVVPK
jgi:[ribosomal protein S18]-alanine N-acetyltransferase